jgi:ankyrin repeat protein
MSIVELINRVRSGDVESVKTFLASHEVDLNQVKQTKQSMFHGGMNEVTPLMVACMQGHLEMIQFLLQQGAQVDFQTKDNWSAFKKAYVDGRVEVVQKLIENGAQRNMKINTKTPLHTSCEKGDIEMVKALLARGMDIDAGEILTFSARHVSEKCADIQSITCDYGHAYAPSPVNIAVDYEHVELVKWLLENGMEVPYGALFLAIASNQNGDELLATLLKHGADVNMTGDGGWSVLMLAIAYGKSRMVEMFLERGADVNYQDQHLEFALSLAAERGILEVVQLLLDRGADINMTGKGGCTALYKAIIGVVYPERIVGLFDTIKLLLEKGAKDLGQTAFELAVQVAPAIIVKLFLDAGVSVKMLSWKTLTVTCSLRRIEVLKLFLDSGLDVNGRDESGKSLLMHSYDLEVVKLLLEKGANVNLQDSDGGHALLNACRGIDYSIANLLLKNGADVNLCHDNGVSASSILGSFSMVFFF